MTAPDAARAAVRALLVDRLRAGQFPNPDGLGALFADIAMLALEEEGWRVVPRFGAVPEPEPCPEPPPPPLVPPPPAPRPVRSVPDPPRLTERQHRMLVMIAEGLTTAQIARRMHTSPNTAKTTMSRTFSVLGARSRSHAAALGVVFGLVGPADVLPARRLAGVREREAV